jgi:hypothetical protein
MEEMVSISRLKYEGLNRQMSLQKQSCNSRTSSICRSNINSLRKVSEKNSGGQSGHENHHLLMSANPDKFILNRQNKNTRIYKRGTQRRMMKTV